MYISRDDFEASRPHYNCTLSNPSPISSTPAFGNFNTSTFLPNPGQGLPCRLLDDEERLWAGARTGRFESWVITLYTQLGSVRGERSEGFSRNYMVYQFVPRIPPITNIPALRCYNLLPYPKLLLLFRHCQTHDIFGHHKFWIRRCRRGQRDAREWRRSEA